MAGDGHARLFVAVPMTDDARRAVAAHLRTAAPEGMPGRPVPADNWHLTLRFLGASTPAQRRGMAEALTSADLGGSFAVRFSGLGAFPRPRSARVVWMGITEGVERLQELARIAEQGARENGAATGASRSSEHSEQAKSRQHEERGSLPELT